MNDKIELVNALPTLEAPYRNTVRRIITEKKITLKEWNNKYKHYRDEYGYSIIHYFEAYIREIEAFVTNNPIMLKNKIELKKIFGIEILTVGEMMEEKE